ncbi:integrase catalytic domain-containing protein [Trichonephila clavipes]|nr:integrase catalytic domain-containing protein [Trichonephila clavipes]
MDVNDQKNICLGINDSRVLQKLATRNIFISDSSVNNKLCLFEKHSDEIHILLGSDIVGKLFTGEVKQLSEGLTAVNTRLGWTVMGKLSCESEFKLENSLLVHSLYTNREEISNLWELDSIGIKNPSEKKSKLELQDLALKHFENTIL